MASDVVTMAVDWEQFDKTDILFIIFCSTICWQIVPAVGLAYAGYSTRRNAMSAIYTSLLVLIVCTIQWYLIGYSIAYSDGNGLFGDLSHAFHIGAIWEPMGTIPTLLFSQFQLIFCATVAAISIGGACERGRLLPLIPFIFLWATLVYCPLAHMVWSDNGYLGGLGVLDFAGGTPVHVCSGATATAMSVYLSHPLFRSRASKERTPSHLKLHKPHNSLCQLIAMATIWGGWLAFDAGTTLSLNFKSVMAFAVTNTCAASGAMTWSLINYWETGRFSLDSTFLGTLSGLVMITPAAGFVHLGSAFCLGIVGALIIRQALRIKFTDFARKLKWVDNGDTFATHCIGGFAATIFTGLFASKDVAAYDGETDIVGGVLFDGNIRQIGIQILEATLGFAWSFGVSYIIYAVIDCIPGLEVLAKDEDVLNGLDTRQIDESIYSDQWRGEEDYQPFERSISLT
ncbi:unnamed protein product [Clonostachys rosea f. rosea IK726]|uniref:Ammonium transporter AmtB-like domain-containing protein n=2 Tax=Bionectria ochroleuca TaxID=29856 RepID=A0A0B7KF06_BIOOC|nr:unnamed protein product [Clonostachys rosea f. rosea IK726]